VVPTRGLSRITQIVKEDSVEPAVADDQVVAHIAASYTLVSPISGVLIRRGFNDHYLIETPGGRQIFRIYHREKLHISSVAEMQFELDLLRHLSHAGVSVAAPIPAKDGQLIRQVPERALWGALFEFAPGDKVRLFTDAQAKAFGEVVARMHVEADNFISDLPRYHLDVDALLDGPLRLAAELVGDDLIKADRAEFAYLRAAVESLGKTPGGYGIIHGDCHSPNLHLDGDRPTLFDFDHCAYGWRAYDLASCFLSLEQPADASGMLNPPPESPWGSFLQGYGSVRAPLSGELEAIPAFSALRAVWDIGNVIANARGASPAEANALAESVPLILDFAIRDALA